MAIADETARIEPLPPPPAEAAMEVSTCQPPAASAGAVATAARERRDMATRPNLAAISLGRLQSLHCLSVEVFRAQPQSPHVQTPPGPAAMVVAAEVRTGAEEDEEVGMPKPASGTTTTG